jgi:hypothetical protein
MRRRAKLKSKQGSSVRKKQDLADLRTKTLGITIPSVLRTVSDPISIELFKAIAAEGSDGSTLRNSTKLSRRQYYSRLSAFMKNGMVTRKRGRNYRTAFGRIVYHTILTLENAFANYYKLKAIDSIGLAYDIPMEEHKKILDNLIADPEIRQILSARRTPNSS